MSARLRAFVVGCQSDMASYIPRLREMPPDNPSTSAATSRGALLQSLFEIRQHMWSRGGQGVKRTLLRMILERCRGASTTTTAGAGRDKSAGGMMMRVNVVVDDVGGSSSSSPRVVDLLATLDSFPSCDKEDFFPFLNDAGASGAVWLENVFLARLPTLTAASLGVALRGFLVDCLDNDCFALERVRKGAAAEDGEFDVYWTLRWVGAADRDQFDPKQVTVCRREEEEKIYYDDDNDDSRSLMTRTTTFQTHPPPPLPPPRPFLPNCPAPGIYPVASLNDKFARLMKETKAKFKRQVEAVRRSTDHHCAPHKQEKWRGTLFQDSYFLQDKYFKHNDNCFFEFLHLVDNLGLACRFVTTKLIRRRGGVVVGGSFTLPLDAATAAANAVTAEIAKSTAARAKLLETSETTTAADEEGQGTAEAREGNRGDKEDVDGEEKEEEEEVEEEEVLDLYDSYVPLHKSNRGRLWIENVNMGVVPANRFKQRLNEIIANFLYFEFAKIVVDDTLGDDDDEGSATTTPAFTVAWKETDDGAVDMEIDNEADEEEQAGSIIVATGALPMSKMMTNVMSTTTMPSVEARSRERSTTPLRDEKDERATPVRDEVPADAAAAFFAPSALVGSASSRVGSSIAPTSPRRSMITIFPRRRLIRRGRRAIDGRILGRRGHTHGRRRRRRPFSLHVSVHVQVPAGVTRVHRAAHGAAGRTTVVVGRRRRRRQNVRLTRQRFEAVAKTAESQPTQEVFVATALLARHPSRQMRRQTILGRVFAFVVVAGGGRRHRRERTLVTIATVPPGRRIRRMTFTANPTTFLRSILRRCYCSCFCRCCSPSPLSISTLLLVSS